MNFSIIFCHFKTGKMSAYTVAKLIEHSKNHNIEILISDNNAGDGSIEYLKPFADNITVINYPKNVIQSHGCGYDYLMKHVSNEWVISMESDSFPANDNWLDYYEQKINEGYDCVGSKLKLSGGEYVHPAGMLFRKSSWLEAKEYCDNIAYTYFPNMASKEGFDCHLMIHRSIINQVLDNPEDYIELSNGYKGLSPSAMIAKSIYYKPVASVFHNGMGNKNESVKTYGQRTIESEAGTALLDNKRKLIHRVGAEPGQYFCWWQVATGKKLFYAPTIIQWLKGRENQQQEYTIMENGLTHLWGISAYHNFTPLGGEDMASVKQSLPEVLYNTLPNQYRI